MIIKVSRQLTKSLINNKIIEFDEFPIYQYGIEVILIALIETMGIFTIALMTGYTYEALIFILAFSSIRVYAGGYHAKTVMKCFSYFVLLGGGAISLAKLSKLADHPFAICVIAIIASLIIFHYAPVSVVNRPITENERIKFRSISIKISTIYLVIVLILSSINVMRWYVGIFALGMLLEAMMLLVEKYRRILL